MESQRLIEIANDVENKSNKDLLIVVNELSEEFEKTKELYLAGEETTAVMNQANSLIQKIIKVYYS